MEIELDKIVFTDRDTIISKNAEFNELFEQLHCRRLSQAFHVPSESHPEASSHTLSVTASKGTPLFSNSLRGRRDFSAKESPS